MKENAWRKTQETSLQHIYLSLYCKGLKGLLKGLHVRGCWRPNVNFIFWPHCYDRHVVSFLFSWFWGQLHRGFSECPLGRVWPSLPHLVSTVWNSTGNCIGGFPSAPSVGCGLPYHIWSLLSGILLATASGVFRVPPRSGVAFPTTSGLYYLEFDWQLLWDPNSTELNNNSTPTRSPTGSLDRMFNRHQAEITVMQFRGYSLPVHDCNGTMRPSPCPIS